MAFRGSLFAMRDCSAWARGVRFEGGRGGRNGCGVVRCEGGRADAMRLRAAERECGPVWGAGESMSGFGLLV